MANGPLNATAYRLYKAKGGMAKFAAPDLPDLLKSSHGTEQIETEKGASGKKGNKVFKYEREHAYSIVGIAWYINQSILLKHPDDYPTAVELLKPTESRPLGYNEKPPRQLAFCIVKIKWRINGNDVCSWESRQTARRVFGGKDKGDTAIYIAAQNQEYRFYESGTDEASWPGSQSNTDAAST